MPSDSKNIDELKRKLRALKKFELNIRFKNYFAERREDTDLIWNKFFGLKKSTSNKVKYSLEKISSMSKEEIRKIINEYLYHLFLHYCREKGIADSSFIDIDLLSSLGLPLDSEYDDVVKKFKELIKIYHPDNGGDVRKFLEIMDAYNKLRGE
ncbi:MAG TPA: J domain-containing protein [Mobilitalea sp.]|nr:J domain-containing protein [Mobilitalea sp.]